MHRVVKRTAEQRAAQRAADARGMPRPAVAATYLDGHKNFAGRWFVTVDEAERFAAARKQAKVVLGYDITFSVPKSVSAVYAQGTDGDRVAIDGAIEAAVAAGMAYLERESFSIRRRGVQEPGGAMIAASYRHYTNWNLEPQLHEHVVIANMATNTRGDSRAVDGRGLFSHATTAGHLAGAELRHQLAARLGFSWTTPHKGLADIAGVDRSTIMAISTRRQDVLKLSNELGYHTPEQRQRAAIATRPGKDRSVDGEALRSSWRKLLDASGLTAADVEQLHDTNERTLWTRPDTTELFTYLAGRRGVTEQTAIFDRRDVIHAIANFANDRATAAEIEDLADRWLGTDAVVPLDVADDHGRDASAAAAATLTPTQQRYTTPHMLRIEERVLSLHAKGRRGTFGTVSPPAVETAISRAAQPLGAEQASMVRAICTSGHQFQAVVGRAGAGKTTAITIAVDAWQRAGYRVIGAAPFGEAARKLEQETGLRSSTLAGLLTRLDTAADRSSVIGTDTIIVVDEASTIGNRQLDQLYRYAADLGATVRTIGDPQQHQSVEAGGLWRYVTTRFSADTPTLRRNRRQVGEDMGQVRLALDAYRNGLIGQALQRLDNDDRIVTAPTWEALLDHMAAEWLVDHRRHIDHGAAESKMVAERNSDRHALNHRAQALLRSEGLLGSPVPIGQTDFHVGDRVVAQARNNDLRSDGADRRHHVINGSQGTVRAITGAQDSPGLAIDFDDLGVINVPHAFIVTEVGPGRGGGITPAYAVTSFKAEGQTFDAGRNLAAPGAVDTAGMYVALTRGRHDQRTYTIAPSAERHEAAELPILTDDRTATEALADALAKPRSDDLATVADPAAATTAADAGRPLDQISGRAQQLAEHRIAARAIHDPDPVTIAALGPRPPRGTHRDLWDFAVGETALYRARWGVRNRHGDGSLPQPVAGDRPEKWKHYAVVDQAVESAQVEHLANTPLHELATEHAALRAACPETATHDADRVHRNFAQAEAALQQARAALRAAQGLELNLRSPRRRTPLEAELAHRATEAAKRNVAACTTDLERATQRRRCSDGDPSSRAVVNARLATIDRAFARRIDKAASEPAQYLTDALGPRPHNRTDDERWTAAARAIESYRHRHLHLTPSDGPYAFGTGLRRAIGPQPTAPGRAAAWSTTNEAIDRYLTPARPHEQPLQRRR